MKIIMKKRLCCILFVFLSFSFLCFSQSNKNSNSDAVFQDFEGTGEILFWPMHKKDQLELSTGNDPVFEGKKSLKFFVKSSLKSKEDGPFWHGCDILSLNGKGAVDLNPDGKNKEFILWIYALPVNKDDNHLNIRFYDNGKHSTIHTKVEQWLKEKAVYGKWTKLTISFSKLPKTFDFHNVTKIQLVPYWPGTYYIDYMASTR